MRLQTADWGCCLTRCRAAREPSRTQVQAPTGALSAQLAPGEKSTWRRSGRATDGMRWGAETSSFRRGAVAGRPESTRAASHSGAPYENAIMVAAMLPKLPPGVIIVGARWSEWRILCVPGLFFWLWRVASQQTRRPAVRPRAIRLRWPVSYRTTNAANDYPDPTLPRGMTPNPLRPGLPLPISISQWGSA